jgi:ankyrin repeat protein
LLDGRADVNARAKNGWTALMMAAAYFGNTETLRMLVDAGSDVNAKGEKGLTAIELPYAVNTSDNDEEIVQFLRNAGAVEPPSLIVGAAGRGHTTIVRSLIAKGADVNAKWMGGTALMWAAKWGHTKTVNALLNAGADVNVKNKSGRTALTYAKEKSHAEIVQLLKQAGAKE